MREHSGGKRRTPTGGFNFFSSVAGLPGGDEDQIQQSFFGKRKVSLSIASLKVAFLIACMCSYQVRGDNEVAVMQAFRSSYPDWKPRGIIDVGANKGGWTHKVQSKLYPGVPTIMIEASPQHNETLQQVKAEFAPHVDYRIAVMSGKDGDQVEFFGFGGTGDSMFQENTKFYEGHKPTIRTTAKLDTLVKHMEHIDYLKLDVQGAELMVLAGASETLKRVTIVQLEVSVVDYNKGGACWFELDSYLRNHGFYFYDSGDYSKNLNLFHSKGMGQFDVLYINPTSDYLPDWLKKTKPQFCGAGRESGGTADAQSVVAGASDGATTKAGVGYETVNYYLTMYRYLAAFLAGYVTCLIMPFRRIKIKKRNRLH